MTRKAIQDKFSKLKVSRQRKWQLRRKEVGLCSICGKAAVIPGLCDFHRKYHNNKSKAWYKAHPKRCRAMQAKWRKENPNYFKEWRAKRNGAH